MADTQKKSVLIIGGGSVGAIAALNLEVGGLATVTVVLRSNYDIVSTRGYKIESCDHGSLKGWKPSFILPAVPSLTDDSLPPYDYIVLTTKSTPDIPPAATALLAPALPPTNTHTTLLLLQNGLNIERPFLVSHPTTPLLSGVSLIGSAEPSPGTIIQDDRDRLLVGAFPHPTLPASDRQARHFVRMYAAGGKTECTFSADVPRDRWRKLVYNACLNPICAITGLDTGRVRLAGEAVATLVRPAMREIVAAAEQVAGVKLGGEDVVEEMVEMDALELYLAPSMLADVRKGNFIEFENLLGEPLREGKAAGVPMPTLEVLYNIAKAIQWRTKEARGMVQIPEKRSAGKKLNE
ncbi:ketopantoate reductase PanE/ApbA C terminal-domain-containing protein [Massariosphaeria phaeospora]|uniref:2-dehydropantoate 2-reductase n=1 Tax=Massariosphaeria phaeospora TaxID=100035 RepID=A0A7C8MJB5_9PLEO|nr:ketopantoate reductase PanE/ApbA C terminal-domain-containing protein [Massariosphaeria phaeospora]